MDHETVTSGETSFGLRFTEHMAVARSHARHGWAPTEVVPFADLSLSPAATVFHYGQVIFEGLKAFRQPDGSVALFRPHDHATRFDRSARRLVMPELPPGAFVRSCVELVRADTASVPHTSGHSLYLRPMLIATETGLGVRPSEEYLFAVIASPVGSYFSSGIRPLTVWVVADDVRAVPGGTGSAKCAGNYAASLAAKVEATAHGCDETVWLDAIEHRWIEELSGMNIVFVARSGNGDATTLVSPPAGGTILDGITRKSLLELARALGFGVVERPVSIQELCDATSFVEAFACGTAAGVAPITLVRSVAGEWAIGDGAPGPVTLGLRDALLAVQAGRADDPGGWRQRQPGSLHVAGTM